MQKGTATEVTLIVLLEVEEVNVFGIEQQGSYTELLHEIWKWTMPLGGMWLLAVVVVVVCCSEPPQFSCKHAVHIGGG